MELPFTVEQFFGVFRLYNSAVWPAQVFLTLLAALALIPIAFRRPWSGAAVSAILALLWVWIGIAYHLAFFTDINPLAYAFGATSKCRPAAASAPRAPSPMPTASSPPVARNSGCASKRSGN